MIRLLVPFGILLSIERQTKCWLVACMKDDCTDNFLYCERRSKAMSSSTIKFCSPKKSKDDKTKTFDFGMYAKALEFDFTKTSFRPKFFYSFWWALQNVRLVKVFHCDMGWRGEQSIPYKGWKPLLSRRV